jgi:class 3 adenylate cyclase
MHFHHDKIFDLNDDDASSCTSSRPSTSNFFDDGQDLCELNGQDSAFYIDRGLYPATQHYAQATVLYMDIVDFTRQCMAKPLDEISGWMTRIHTAIDELLDRHAIRKVETRGDCVICVSGTNYVHTEGGASRDLCGDQATRMLSFGRDLGLALSAIDGTAARLGVATGPVVLTHISHGGDTLPAKYIYGDTVNVACRMEQTGRAGAVQLAESAARAYAAERGEAPPPLRTKEIKGKGTMRTALFDCAAGRFVDEGAPAAA